MGPRIKKILAVCLTFASYLVVGNYALADFLPPSPLIFLIFASPILIAFSWLVFSGLFDLDKNEAGILLQSAFDGTKRFAAMIYTIIAAFLVVVLAFNWQHFNLDNFFVSSFIGFALLTCSMAPILSFIFIFALSADSKRRGQLDVQKLKAEPTKISKKYLVLLFFASLFVAILINNSEVNPLCTEGNFPILECINQRFGFAPWEKCEDDACLEQRAIVYADLTYCEKITSNNAKNRCYYFLAVRTKNEALCPKISKPAALEEDYKAACFNITQR